MKRDRQTAILRMIREEFIPACWHLCNCLSSTEVGGSRDNALQKLCGSLTVSGDHPAETDCDCVQGFHELVEGLALVCYGSVASHSVGKDRDHVVS